MTAIAFYVGCSLKDNSVTNNERENEVSRECIFTTIASEAAGLYNLLITLSTGMFGGTLLFLDKIAPSPTKNSLWFLGLGWVMLLFCTIACAWIRWKNLESGRLALEGKFKDAQKVDRPNRMLTKFAIFSLGLGITFIGIFGCVNMVAKVNANERSNIMVEDKDKYEQKESKKEVIQKGIPFGSINLPEEEQVSSNNQSSNGNTEDDELDNVD